MALPRFGENNDKANNNSPSRLPEAPTNSFPPPPSFNTNPAPREEPVVSVPPLDQRNHYNDFDAPNSLGQELNTNNYSSDYDEKYDHNTQEDSYDSRNDDASSSSSYNEEEYDEAASMHERLKEAYADLKPDIQDALDALMNEITSDESTEVNMNGPNAIFNKSRGKSNHLPINFKDVKTYHHIIDTFILPYTDTHERLFSDQELIEGQLTIDETDDYDNPLPPTVARVHIMAPPAVKWAQVTIAKKSKVSITIEEIQQSGAMTRNMAEFLKLMIKGRVTTVVFGASGGGKTTLLEALAKYFDPNDRILVIEDTPELRISSSPNVVYLNAVKPKPSEKDTTAAITLEWHVQQANRMRPDRIVVGEIRGSEMSEFLNAANSGYDGSLTTVHANSPKDCLRKISLFASKGENGNRSENALNRQIASSVQLLVQCEKVNGKHIITSITEVGSGLDPKGGNVTSDIFLYDPLRGRHIVGTRPSELPDFLAASGITLPAEWFSRDSNR